MKLDRISVKSRKEKCRGACYSLTTYDKIKLKWSKKKGTKRDRERKRKIRVTRQTDKHIDIAKGFIYVPIDIEMLKSTQGFFC